MRCVGLIAWSTTSRRSHRGRLSGSSSCILSILFSPTGGKSMPLHLDPNLQQLSPEEVAKLELRACCICGVIKNANDMEECLTCDGFMCAEHKCDEHTCD